MHAELAEEAACLFVVGSYHIGKERAYLGAAQALGCKVRQAAAVTATARDCVRRMPRIVPQVWHAAALHVVFMARYARNALSLLAGV
jgi:hypothetical protein